MTISRYNTSTTVLHCIPVGPTWPLNTEWCVWPFAVRVSDACHTEWDCPGLQSVAVSTGHLDAEDPKAHHVDPAVGCCRLLC